MGIFAHRDQIMYYHDRWNRKPALRTVYRSFYRMIKSRLSSLPQRKVVELGSGIGSIKDVIPDCLTTDTFPTPWNDQVENAYALTFEDRSVTDLIMVDVFHHLEYPGAALSEFHRVLKPGGLVILLEPYISALGFLVFGLLHPEGVRRNHTIQWTAPPGTDLHATKYYASQGNATSVFLGEAYQARLSEWNKVEVVRLSAIDYIATGGYSKAQVVPTAALSLLRRSERPLSLLPQVFATRMLVILTA